MKTHLLILFTLFSFNSFCQISWERPYGTANRVVLLNAIHAYSDNFYICGSDTSNNSHRAYLAKLDGQGNMIWERHYAIQDSDYFFENMLLFDSNTIIIKASTIYNSQGAYHIPRVVKVDLLGNVLDSTWIDISNVYNSAGSGEIYKGANNTFWEFTYIGTIGISNDISLNRRDSNLNLIYNIHFSAYYDQYFSFNKNGAYVSDVQYDNPGSVYDYYDFVQTKDTAGVMIDTSSYLNLPFSNEILYADNFGFTLFYCLKDTLQIRHFDSGGNQIRVKNYPVKPGRIYNTCAASDSGYFITTHNYDLLANDDHTIVYKLNSQDDTLWSVKFNMPATSNFISFNSTLDGGAIILFNNNIYGDSVNYLVRLGPNGERFAFSLIYTPQLFCYGDTVSITTIQPAASYHWSTGDTGAVLNVTRSGNYSAVVTDASGNTYSTNPIPIQFDSLPQFTLNDIHTCSSFVNVYAPFTDGSIFWSYRDTYLGGYHQLYQSQTVPDTLTIWLIHQLGNCRVSDTATIYFEDCTGINENEFENYFNLKTISKDEIQIESLKSESINLVTLFDVAGKLLIKLNAHTPNIIIDISKIPDGIYLIQAETNDLVFIRKMIK